MLKEKRKLIEVEVDLIVERLLSAGLIEDDDEVTAKVANTIESVLNENY